MRHRALCLVSFVVLSLLVMVPAPAVAQETPSSMVATYDAMADAIIGMLDMEESFVRSLLDGHLHAARAAVQGGDWEMAAGHMALFANEGDNAIAGIRKRLLDAGHHHHAEEEDDAVYEDGYVVVTIAAKEELLAATSALRQATDDEARTAAWEDFRATAQEVLSGS